MGVQKLGPSESVSYVFLGWKLNHSQSSPAVMSNEEVKMASTSTATVVLNEL